MFEFDQYYGQSEIQGKLKQGSSATLIDTVLDDNNLKRRQIHQKFYNLFQTFSIGLFGTNQYSANLLKACVNHFKNFVKNEFSKQSNANKKILEFINSKQYQDYCQSPAKTDFEKINSLIISILYKRKIVIYSITDDQYLNSCIINNNYAKSIEVLKIGENYDLVYSIEDYETLEICQTIVYEVINTVLEDSNALNLPIHFKNIEDVNQFIQVPILLNKELIKDYSPQDNVDYFQLRPRHKKSMSETFKGAFDSKAHKETNFNLFSGIKIPHDFLLNIQQDPPKSFINFNALYYILKNTAQPVKDQQKSEQIFFNEEVVKMKSIENEIDEYPNTINPKSPIYYINASPPGITPPKHLIYQQKESLQTGPINQSNNQFFENKEMQGQTKFSDAEKLTLQLKQLLLTNQSPNQSQTQNEESLQDQNTLYSKRTGVSKIPILKTQFQNDSTYNQFNQQFHENEQFQPAIFPQPNSAFQQFQHQNLYYQQQQQQQQQLQQNFQAQQQGSIKKPPIILDEGKVRYEGYLKFFDETKNYGFLVMDIDKSDIFVHFDDLYKIGITKEFLKTAKAGNFIRFSFCCLAYMGKYNRLRKAVELELLPCTYD